VATPPNPDNPTIKVSLSFTQTDALKGGCRLFFNYSGSAPSGTQCATLATYIGGTDFPDELGGLINTSWALTEVDVLDITTSEGLSGKWTGSEAGTRSGTALPAQVSSGVEFNIAKRYRGGKPRIYLPPAVTSDLANESNYTSTFAGTLATDFGTFISGIAAQGLTAANDLTHVLLSYYQGVNTATPPWRGPGFKYPPKYRATAVSYNVSGYAGKAMLNSQKRRRVATTA
jgi:hypothetical protein